MLKHALAALTVSAALSAPALAAGTDFISFDMLSQGDMTQQFVDLVNDGHKIKKVAVFGEYGAVILYDYNGWWAKSVPQELVTKLDQISKTDQELKSIAFTKEGGFTVLFGQHDYFTSGIDTNAYGLSLLQTEAAAEFRDVAFPADGGIVLLEASGGYAWNGLADNSELARGLKSLADQNLDIDTLFVSPTGGYVAMNQGQILFTENLSENLVSELYTRQYYGQQPLSLSFLDDDRWILVW